MPWQRLQNICFAPSSIARPNCRSLQNTQPQERRQAKTTLTPWQSRGGLTVQLAFPNCASWKAGAVQGPPMWDSMAAHWTPCNTTQARGVCSLHILSSDRVRKTSVAKGPANACCGCDAAESVGSFNSGWYMLRIAPFAARQPAGCQPTCRSASSLTRFIGVPLKGYVDCTCTLDAPCCAYMPSGSQPVVNLTPTIYEVIAGQSLSLQLWPWRPRS